MTRLNWPFWPTVPVAIGSGAAMGAIFAVSSWRLKGDYVALTTLAAGIIIQQVMLNWTEVTGGADGIANIPLVAIGGHILSDNDYYVLLLGVGLLCTAAGVHLIPQAFPAGPRLARRARRRTGRTGIRDGHPGG